MAAATPTATRDLNDPKVVSNLKDFKDRLSY